MIQPYFDHCSVVWDGCGTTQAGKIQKLQNRAARALTVSAVHRSRRAGAGVLTYFAGAGAGVCLPPVKL